MASPAPAPAASSKVFQLERNRKFLKGKASVGVKVTGARDQDVLLAIARDEAFPRRQIGVGEISVGVEGGNEIQFGSGKKKVAFSAGAEAFSGIGVYPDPSKMLRDLSPNENIAPAISFEEDAASNYLMLRWGYGFSGTAKGSVALGTGGSVTFNAEGSKKRAFAVIRRLPAAFGARTAIAETVQSWMLPRQAASDSDLEPGTWLVAEVDGSIAAKVGVQFGYDFNWVQEAKLGGLTGDIGLRLQAGASAALGFSASGKYAVVLSRESLDAAERTLRLQLFKLSTRGWNFAFNAGVNVQGDFKKFLPKQFDDFVKAVFGVHGAQIIADLKVIEEWNDPDTPLSGKLAGLSSEYVQKFLKDVTGVDPKTAFNEARNRLTDLIKKWEALPHNGATLLWKLVEQKADLEPIRKITNLIADSDRKQLAGALAGQLSRVDFFDSNEGRLLQALASRGILAALNSSAEFKELQDAAKAVAKVLDKGTVEETLKRLQQSIEKRLKLDQVKKVVQETDFNRLDQWLQLKLAEFLDDKLNLQRLDQIRKTIDLLLAKRQEFYEKALKALNRHYEFSLAYTYQRTTKKTALFDIEFDFAGSGQVGSLLKAALQGDFDKVMVRRVDGVKLNLAALTHELERQSSVEVTLPSFKKSVTRLNKALGKVNAIDEEDGRILVYGLTAQDRVTTVVENKMARDSSLIVGVEWKESLGNAVKKHNPEAVSYSYTFRQVRRGMKLAELQHQVKPYVQKYLPGSFSARSNGVVAESFDVWVEALDTFVENLEGNGPGIFGDTLISLDLSLSAEIASAWLNAPPKDPKNYADMSRRIQGALKELIPFYYFQDPKKYKDLDAAAPLLLYSSIPPSTSIKVQGNKVTPNTDKKIYWNWPDRNQRSSMARIPQTSANLKEALLRASEVLAARPDLNKTLEFYEGELALDRVISTSLKQDGNRRLQSLLRNESRVVESAFQAGCRMAEFRKQRSKKPSEAIEALAEFGKKLTKAFNDNISGVYGGSALRPLGTLVFLEAARGLARSQPANAKPSAMFALAVLKQGAEFNPLNFAKNQRPAKEDVLVSERLVSLV